MGGFFGVASQESCTFDLFFGTDYHSHLGTRRAGMAVYGKENGFEIRVEESYMELQQMLIRRFTIEKEEKNE